MKKMLLCTGLFLLTGCSAAKESEDDATKIGTLKAYESSFHPSEFDQPLKDFFPETRQQTRNDTGNTTLNLTLQSEELTQGYRVQIFATTGYDDVTKMKGTAEGQFPDEWFYVVYDAPTYKLRAGNFLERYEADRFAKRLADRGFKDAWVVPERVYKELPPRSAVNQDPGK